MKVVVITNDELKEEMMMTGLNEAAEINWVNEIESMPSDADAYIDLLFDTDRNKRLEILKKGPTEIVIVNDVIQKSETLPANFIRINGWPTFLRRTITEATAKDESIKSKAEEVLRCFTKKTEWVPDMPGFITATVVSSIVNEAYFALEDEVSTRDEIDIAMKLGTNYPYGPFEWSKLIGAQKIYSLLNILSNDNPRYIPSSLLKNEANS